MDTIEQKLKDFREALLDKDYPLGIDEILGYVEYLYEDDKEIKSVLHDYIDDYYKMWSCTKKFYKVKDLIDEQFYAISEEDNE
jgi:hypothetical protein